MSSKIRKTTTHREFWGETRADAIEDLADFCSVYEEEELDSIQIMPCKRDHKRGYLLKVVTSRYGE